MNKVFLFFQIGISVLLIALVLLQNKEGGINRSLSSISSSTRRGLEKIIFKLTFIVVFIFILFSIISILV